MKTVHYTLTTWDAGAMASGFDSAPAPARQAASPQESRPQAQGKVIDLAAWRAAHPQPPRDSLAWDVDGADWREEAPASRGAPRLRRSRRTALYAELASTLAVACAALTLIVRVLVF